MASPHPVQPLVGNDCGLFYNTSYYETPTWVEIDEAGEVSLSDWNVSEAEIVTRASDWAVNLAAKFRAAIEFQYLWGANWAVLDELRIFFMARTKMDVLFMDFEDLTSVEPYAQGLRLPVQIRQFPINQPNEEVAKVDTCRMTPTYALTAGGVRIDPQWVFSDGLGAVGPVAPVGTFAAGPFIPEGFGQPAQSAAMLQQLKDMGKAQSYPIMAYVPLRILKGTPHASLRPLPEDMMVFAPAEVAIAQGYKDIPQRVLDAVERVKQRKAAEAKSQKAKPASKA